MNITQAQQKIDQKRTAGLISNSEARWYEKMIRRTEAYGHRLSWQQQARMRDNLLRDF